mgnify:CR=1 FL=1
MAGAPIGNQNAAKAKIWHGAIMRALRNRSRTDALEALDELAEKLLEKVAEGDLPALKEFGDRLDGKPAQAITGPEGEALEIRVIERVIVRE